jgi:hypothetical protein
MQIRTHLGEDGVDGAVEGGRVDGAVEGGRVDGAVEGGRVVVTVDDGCADDEAGAEDRVGAPEV